jgi:ribosomal protein L7Ae-like RNA K-turn-binding protein
VENKVLNLLGIARRAGHVAIGFDAVKSLLISNRAQFILLAADRSPKTEKELRYTAQNSSCPIHVLAADKEALAHALGLQKPVAVAATDDRGFAAAMRNACGTDTKEDVAL